MPVGAPNSPARWLSENIGTIPAAHKFALMEMRDGQPVLVVSGTKATCKASLTDHTRQVVCELGQYRK
jgi:hypothetical protein